MASDVSMKISKAYYEGTLKLHPPIVNILAEHLDSMGVGEAFEFCQKMLDNPSMSIGCGRGCDCLPCTALRKAGMV